MLNRRSSPGQPSTEHHLARAELSRLLGLKQAYAQARYEELIQAGRRRYPAEALPPTPPRRRAVAALSLLRALSALAVRRERSRIAATPDPGPADARTLVR